ncbi:gliding motility-associated peptidyl-prolyl isomerase GldI [Polaribacter litorisediminis]|uniref:gliding motility-associated peptidyl-prolyl isomerase GldI n=1 Tax=Polaribacter litorisediminis TaxID=1908341 RepID=UPI001CBB1983|nr:gliding motility-associated peptidyl-prolyl isomerase GldI [Polaribacter litorisediminis]UAM99263.1 gliding motility-associated peptidyl-prolyl isomerase GldI [Polaribacter litorisediminis]
MRYRFLFIAMIIFLSCSKMEPRRPIHQKPSTTLYFEAMEENKRLNQIEDEKILKVIEKDSLNLYLQSSSGFWYTYIKKIEQDLPTPKKGDEVVLMYNITDLKDAIIYSKEELGVKNYIVDKEDFISGLQKGIKLMKIGETITFVIPSYSAFGITGDGDKIGINQSIKSTVTLINIK